MTDKLLCGTSESTSKDAEADQDQKSSVAEEICSKGASAPILVLMAGFAGAGKTTLATWLHQKFGWTILSKDQLKRTRLARGEEVSQAAEQAFEDLFMLIEEEVIKQGRSVIVDTSNEKPFVFEGISRVLEQITEGRLQPHLKVVLCVANKETRTQRLYQRGSVFAPYVQDLPVIWDDTEILQLYRHLFSDDPHLFGELQRLLSDSDELEHFKYLPGAKAFIVNTCQPLEAYSQLIGEDLKSYIKGE